MIDPASGTAALGEGPAVLAFDVGGTDTKAALLDSGGRLRGIRRRLTARDPREPARAVVAAIAAIAADLRAAHPGIRPVVAGVSVPGLVDETTGIGVFSSNLGWRDAPIRDLAASALALPVAFGHDVRRAGEAELRLGAARGCRDAVIVTIGTGIAGALVVDGRMHAGDGFAGEIGHMLSDPDGEPCGCGGIGCLETIASAAAIARRYGARTGVATAGATDVLSALHRGDADAAEVWADAIAAIADQLARIASLLAPQVVVIGGGLAHAGAALFDPLSRALEARLSFQRRPALVAAALGGDAGLLGTALAARDLAVGGRA